MHKPKIEFSKTLLKQESALIWIMSLSFIVLAFYCIHEGFTGSLPWLAAMVGFPWTAYGVSQAMYYRKSQKENTVGGVKYESVILEAQQKYKNATSNFDFTLYNCGVDPLANTATITVNPNTEYEATNIVDEYQI